MMNHIEHPAAALLAGGSTLAIGTDDPLKGAIVAFASAVLAWATSWVLGKIRKAIGG